MILDDSQNLSLGEAASRFLGSLSPEEKSANQPGIYRFVRWFGGERPLAGLTPAEVANYAERLSISDTDYLRKLALVRAFLIAAKKKKWSSTSLSSHLKAKKGKNRVTKPRPSPRPTSPAPVLLTSQGYDKLEADLATLKNKRPEIVDEIRRAAADKDFRENVPLQAAKEQLGQLEGRILELEETFKSATVIDEEQKTTLKVSIGNSVILCDLDSGEELHYTLVSPQEVDAAKNKISIASPVGKAVIDRDQGETVEVTVPAGKLRYQIKQVER